MRKYIIKILNVICIACFFLSYGCNEQEEKRPETTVVSKKIVRPKQENQPVKNDQRIEPIKPATIKEVSIQEDSKLKTDTTDKINTSPNQKLDQNHDQNPDQKIELSESTVIYKVEGKVDPFASIFGEGVSALDDQKDKKRIPLTPIEKVDLSELKLVGIIFAPSGNKALVENVSGKGFVIKKGTRIGINFGKVIKILKNSVVVKEEAESILGQITLVERELTLQKSPGEE
ncbi:MAG: pilus assembly protein PilP [Desulfobacterales bacterium]|nr:pilus assembly protein PilP [Desulfobacterales bacterium]